MTTKPYAPVIYREKIHVNECSEVGTVSQRESPEKVIVDFKEATELYP